MSCFEDKLFEDHIPYLVLYSFLGRSLSKISYFECGKFRLFKLFPRLNNYPFAIGQQFTGYFICEAYIIIMLTTIMEITFYYKGELELITS